MLPDRSEVFGIVASVVEILSNAIGKSIGNIYGIKDLPSREAYGRTCKGHGLSPHVVEVVQLAAEDVSRKHPGLTLAAHCLRNGLSAF